MEPYARIGVIFLIFWAITSCQKASVKPADTPFQVGPGGVSTEYIEDLLSRAREAEPLKRVQLELSAIEALLEAGNYDWARSLTEELPKEALNSLPAFAPERGRFALANAQLNAQAGERSLGLAYVNGEQLLKNLAYYPPDLTARIRETRASLLFDLGDYITAIDERIHLSAILDDNNNALINFELLWQTLMQLPLEQLQQQVQVATSRAHEGWYRLAVISKHNQTNMRAQLAELEQWRRQWPEHPASLNLPADLQLLNELVENRASQVAVLLPESGRLKVAADAIRNGLLAAYYQHTAEEPTPLRLRFYDTESGDINLIYQTALDDGAELVIGPLDKEKIVQLSNRLNLPVPTLALNTVDNPLGYIGNLFQFGLGVEDEARLAAEKAWRDGHRQMLILAPANAWGERCATAYAHRWTELGGEPIQQYHFEDRNDYANVIRNALHIDESEARAKRIRGIVGRRIEFEPRRRLDLDAVFVAASAAQARQIKPTLAFYYASDVPVYATSNIYEGIDNSKQDQDMNDIMFSTLPWYFNDNLAEKSVLLSSPSGNPKLQSLYALGVDSFYLFPRLKQLQMFNGARFYGQTGALTLAPSGRIIRDQVWAEFTRGRAQELSESY